MDENNQENVTKEGNTEPTQTEAVASGEPGKPLFGDKSMDFINDVSIALTIEVGRTQIKIRDLLNLSKDSIIDLNKGADEPVDIYANGKLISRGNIITVNGKYCVRLASIPQPQAAKTE
ncbi:MAG TPA: flagellar motor switch protein FliN [Gammaproteobacteria bacterium]|nr:flagellar motor switch protein FliN [Gammaproteobacteria bacterium]